MSLSGGYVTLEYQKKEKHHLANIFGYIKCLGAPLHQKEIFICDAHRCIRAHM